MTTPTLTPEAQGLLRAYREALARWLAARGAAVELADRLAAEEDRR